MENKMFQESFEKFIKKMNSCQNEQTMRSAEEEFSQIVTENLIENRETQVCQKIDEIEFPNDPAISSVDEDLKGVPTQEQLRKTKIDDDILIDSSSSPIDSAL